MKILLTATSGPAGISFAKSLRDIAGLHLVGIGAESETFARPFLDSFHLVPFANEPDYLDELKRIIKNEHVDYVIPLVDDELMIISANANELGCKALVSPFETLWYTTNKARAYEALADYLPIAYEKGDVSTFPVFAKPHVGRGGKDTAVIGNAEELARFPAEKYVFQELLQPPEVSVDAFFDLHGRLVVAVPRVRSKIEAGISVEGEVFQDESLLSMVRDIATRMKFIGPVNFQFMRGKDGFILTEINARGSGGMGITIAAGADMPKLAYELMRTGTVGKSSTFRTGVFRNFDEVLARQRHVQKIRKRKNPRDV